MTKKIVLIFLLFNTFVYAQGYIFFSDSPNNLYYDPSWGFASSGSYVELINNNKFPVDVNTKFSGTNALRLSWKSVSGGDWGLACAGENWVARDITNMDSIQFYVYANTQVNNTDLPMIFIEDTGNNKTPKHKLSDYVSFPISNAWKKISVPLSIFKNNPGNVDLTKIKTIYFGQNQSNNDGNTHTIYIDELVMTKNSGYIPPTPTNVSAKGYQKHIEVKWDLINSNEIGGYRIYRKTNNQFNLVGSVDKSNRYFIDFGHEIGFSAEYKVAAVSTSSVESPHSDIVTATTKEMTDDEWLDMLQEATFRYFWDYAHPVSGLARERLGSGNTVTIGGSGFGVMAILVGIERGFISRDEGAAQILKIVTFLKNKANRFHGIWSHWLNGETGNVIPFSQYDDGGDLVESAFMLQGLLTTRQYFNLNNQVENNIRTICTQLWEEAEFDWYKRYAGSDLLYWHWSPNYGWQMNMPIRGWNEAMICYLLGIASPTHPIPATCYALGWAGSANYVNNGTFYGHKIYVGYNYGGPLFFTHYSFLGFDPRNKKDRYANYFINNRNTALVHYDYAVANPNNFPNYSANEWGLTASDDPYGYKVHEPINDNGTISPTAALSSFPYTPEQSMKALKGFYNNQGDKLWGIYGFKDAYNQKLNWYASSYLAIDQGPIIVMVENYRSGLLWNYFMQNPEIQPMLNAIGFVYDSTTAVVDNNNITVNNFELKGNYPNPFNPSTVIEFSIPFPDYVKVEIYDMLGNKIDMAAEGYFNMGINKVTWNANGRASGVYFYKILYQGKSLLGKMMLVK